MLRRTGLLYSSGCYVPCNICLHGHPRSSHCKRLHFSSSVFSHTFIVRIFVHVFIMLCILFLLCVNVVLSFIHLHPPQIQCIRPSLRLRCRLCVEFCVHVAQRALGWVRGWVGEVGGMLGEGVPGGGGWSQTVSATRGRNIVRNT